MHCTLLYRSLKKLFSYTIGLAFFMIILQYHRIIVVTNWIPSTVSITTQETSSHFSLPIIYQERSRKLSDRCSDSRLALYNNHQRFPLDFVDQGKMPDHLFYILRSQSFMYCAVPKVATRTLLTILIYVHLNEISNYLVKNWTEIDFTKVSKNSLVNMTVLLDWFRTRKIPMPKTEGSHSLFTLMHTYLDLLRLDGINAVPHPTPVKIWYHIFHKTFPYIGLSSLSNLSRVFSPSFTRALFVRHPFERLASAYASKIGIFKEDWYLKQYLYDKLRRQICHQYVLFNVSRRSSTKGDPCERIIPSFKHFVQYILHNARTPTKMDSHWQPYSILCGICKFKYNFIGKYETIDKDISYLLERFNLSDWDARRRRGAMGQTKQNYQHLFSSLSDELICQLKLLYADDFHLFNYRFEDYIDRPSLFCHDNPDKNNSFSGTKP